MDATVPSLMPPIADDVARLGGSRLTLGGHNPFLLDQAEKAWIVASGNLDLFAVPVRDGRPAGARTHLMQARPGEILLSLPIVTGDGETGVLAVGGLGTEVISIDRRELERLGPQCLTAIADRWVAALTSVILPASTVWADRIVPVDGEVALKADDRLHGHPRRMSWLTVAAGALEWLDAGAVEGPLPLIGPAWVHAPSGARAAIGTTEGVIEAGELWSGLDGFHAAAMRVVARRLDEQAAEDRRRLARQADSRAQTNRSAYGRLAALMVPGHHPGVISGGSPHFAAFQLVATAIGATAVAPRDGIPSRDHATELARIAATSHLHFRWVMLGHRWWRGEHGPLIGFRSEATSPVALLPRGTGRYVLVDPAAPEPRLVDATVAGGLAHEAVMLYRPLPERSMSVPELVRFGSRGVGFDLTLVLMTGLLVSLLGLIVPVLAGHLFGAVIPQTARGELWQIAAGLVAIAFGGAAFQATQAIALLRFEGRLDWQLQSAVIDRLLALPAPFFRGFTSGDLCDRALGLQAIRTVLTGTTLTAILASAFSLVSFGLLLAYSPKLALVAAGLASVSVIVTVLFSFLRLRQEREQTAHQGRVDGFVVQLLIGIAKLRVAATEHRALATWARLFAAQKQRFVAGRRRANWLTTFEAVFPVLATLTLFAVAAKIMADDLTVAAIRPSIGDGPATALDIGGFLAFNAAFGQLMVALAGLATALTSALTVVPLFERSRPILTTPGETAAGRNPPGDLSGEIELSRVTFRYHPDGSPTLDNLSLRIEPGQFVGIVGPSGSGKSTLFRLLLGFEQPESGGVFYDGKALGTLDCAAVRRQIGVVLQNGRITAGSVFSNIVGSAKLSESDAWAAARMAGLDADIEAMPMGLHTVLQEGGGTLSGGQRQRLMLARALVRRPRILLLDEATSALDNLTQSTVVQSLASLNTTRIVIAHRLSTITSVDRIFVIENGKVTESGTFAELNAQAGAFAELARRQLL